MEQSLDFIYNHFRDIEKDDLEYVYRGEVTAHLVMNILELAKTNLAKADDTRKMRSRIYYVMGEGLQNITAHQTVSDDSSDNSAIVVIYKKRHKYIIATGNLMNRDSEAALREKLETINHLDADGLKELSRETRTMFGFTPEGGASLGLIEMAKRSGNKLDYFIKPVDEAHSYFYLTTEIDTTGTGGMDGEVSYSIKNLIEVHDNFNKNNYNLSFKGDFDQENLLSLLSILKSGMSETKTRIKLYGVMVELLQNIVKHADNKVGSTGWKAGVFYIKEQLDRFSLMAGNYIDKTKSEALAARIERIDSMDSAGLSREYNKILFNLNNDPVSTGLGFIDIRRKSGSKIEYSIVDAGEQRDFFMAKIDVMKVD